MAGPTVTLTFAGDATDLVRATALANRSVDSIGDKVGKGSLLVAAGMAAIGTSAAVGALAAGAALASLPLLIGGLGIAIAAQNEKVKASFTSLKDHVVGKLKELAVPFESVLIASADKAKAAFDRLAPSLGQMFADAAPMVTVLVDAVLKLVEGAMPGLQAAVAAAKPVIDALGAGLAAMGPAISAFFTNLSTGAQGGATAITMLFNAVNWLIPALGSVLGFLGQWSGVIVPAAAALGALAAAVWVVNSAVAAWTAISVAWRAATAAATAIQWALNAALFANPIGLVVLALAALVTAVVLAYRNCETFRNIVNAVWAGIKTAFSAGVSFVKSAIAWFGSLPGTFSGWFNAVKNAIVNKFNEVVAFVRGLPGKFMGALGNLGSLLVNAGQALVNGFLNGVKGAWNRVVSFVRAGVQMIRNLLPFSPAKEGPFSGLGYVTYSGKALTNDFADSIRKGMPNVAAAARGVMDAARGSMNGSMAISGPPRMAAAGSAAAGGTSVRFTGNTSDALATVIMQMIRTGKIQIA